MKNLIKVLLVLTIFGWHSSIQAQIAVGGRLGANLAKIDGMDTNAKIGLDIAVVANIPATETVSIQPELHFLQKGYKLDAGSGDDPTRALNYIEIPVNVKYNFGEAESIGGFLLAGPSIGFGIGWKSKVGGQKDSGSFSDANFKSTDISVNFGGGVNIPISSGTVVIDVRYLLGLTDIFDGEGEAMNRGINFGVGYVTSIGGE